MRNFENIPLNEITRPKQWPTLSRRELTDDGFPVYGANGRIGFANAYTHKDPTIIIGCRGSCGTLHITEPHSYVTGNAMALDALDTNRVDQRYLFYFLRYRGFSDVVSGSSQPQITGKGLARIFVPLPGLQEQRRISEMLGRADALQEKCRNNLSEVDRLLRSTFLSRFGHPLDTSNPAPRMQLSELARIDTGKTPPTSDPENYKDEVPFITPGDLGSIISQTKRHVSEKGALKTKTVEAGATMVCCIGATIGKIGLATKRSAFNQQINAVTWGRRVDPIFGFVALNFFSERIAQLGSSTTLPILNKSGFSRIDFPVPDYGDQVGFAAFVQRVWGAKSKFDEQLEQSEVCLEALLQREFGRCA